MYRKIFCGTRQACLEGQCEICRDLVKGENVRGCPQVHTTLAVLDRACRAQNAALRGDAAIIIEQYHSIAGGRIDQIAGAAEMDTVVEDDLHVLDIGVPIGRAAGNRECLVEAASRRRRDREVHWRL